MDITGVDAFVGYGSYPTGQTQESQSLPKSLEDMVKRLVEDKDEDGNGTLDALEICISDEAFQKADANRDGKLDASELQNSLKDIGKELGPPPQIPIVGSIEEMTKRLIQDKDEDESGTLSLTELGISETTFQKADSNGDGELDTSELMNSAQAIGPELGPPPGMPRLGSSDDDDDDEDEENAQIQALLDLLAKNDDEDATQTSIDALF
jgi:Ca2+-binding EF-hand superfamily protein